MGYRSSVYGVVLSKHWNKLRNLSHNNERFGEWLDQEWEYTFPSWTSNVHKTVTPERDVHFWVIHGIKWYKGHGGLVDKVEEYLISLPDGEWGMIIVGEDTDDNEFYGDPWEYDLYLNRVVDMPGDPAAPRPHVEIDPEPEPLPDVPVPINWLRSVFKNVRKEDDEDS